MAKKASTVFMCQECGYESPKWMGQCICGQWNTMTEEKVIHTSKPEDDIRGRSTIEGNIVREAKAERLSEINTSELFRIDTGISELNRVLGGGLVKGALVLISGEPGIGKSTVILQAASNIAKNYGDVLYVSGEESEEQIKNRADRVCKGSFDKVYVLPETNMENIVKATEAIKPAFLVVDSIQTMFTGEMESAPGSVSQVRACGNALMRLGKVKDIPVFIVAHVTKTGDLAGPKIIEHLVDCVLSFTGERNQELRILRSNKNRFGTTSEIGAFEMCEDGLLEIENLSKTFIDDMEFEAEGSVATAVYEGTRPLLLELQALTAPANVGFARRSSIGIDTSRLNMILAVMERKAGISLINQDVYANIVGGIKPEGTSTDLAVALAVYSSVKGKQFSGRTLALGEIGLTGHLRSVQNCEKIVREAARMGFSRMILPMKNKRMIKEIPENVSLLGVESLIEAIEKAFK